MLVKSDISKRADELNILAAKGQPLPENLTSPEQLYFLSLRALYTDYRNKSITVEQAKKERKQLSKAFIENMYNFQMYKHQTEVHLIYARNFQDIKKNGCEVCNRLYKVLCGLGLDEIEEALKDE